MSATTSRFIFAVLFSTIFLLASCSQQPSNEKKIGIVVPLQHKAMDEIVAGFTDTVKTGSKTPVTFKVANAEGDLNLQRAIVSQMKSEGYDIIVPIGTGATEMTAAVIHQQPIVSLASDLSEADRTKMKPCNLVAVHDEMTATTLIAFIHAVYPLITHIALIHSSADKIFPEVKETVSQGKKLNITVTPLMAASLSDLYTISHSIPNDTQAIFLLKDSLIVSGISTIEQVAEKKHIPLITSDQGSVQDGAGLALGVHEKQIGIDGGELALQVLQHKDICSLPMKEMTKLTVFVNKSSLQKEQQSLEPIKAVASKMGYLVETY